MLILRRTEANVGASNKRMSRKNGENQLEAALEIVDG